MLNLFATIKSILSAKTRKLNRSLQVSNCIDLVSEHQVTLAQAYKKLTTSINDLNHQLNSINLKLKLEQNPTVKAIIEKNIEIINATLDRLKNNKQTIADKLQKTEDSKVILTAKKDLLDSIESLKSVSSNVFEKQEFDVDAIMNEIDKTIRDIESEFQADDELNELVK